MVIKEIQFDTTHYPEYTCGGFKHCGRRECNPNNIDCRECISDAFKAINEEHEGGCNYATR